MSKKIIPAKLELRALKQSLKVRTAKDGSRSIKGVAAPFNKKSVDLGGFIEIIAPGAFKRTLTANPDVLCLRQHDPAYLLGRTKSHTLSLRETKRGLEFECQLPNTSQANDVIESINRGDLDAMSFGFNVAPDGDDWQHVDGQLIRTLLDVDLGEISVVSFPAYLDSAVSLRSCPASLRGLLKRSDSPNDIENGGDLDCDGEDADDPDCQQEDSSDRDDGDDCECECPQCIDDQCELCNNKDCTDTRCNRCAMQAGDGLRMKLLFAHRRN
jgi:hypothetical protein